MHDASGTVIGRTFTTIRPTAGSGHGGAAAGQFGTSPGADSSGRTSWLGSVAMERGPRRSRSLAVLGLALGVALVLGVVVAIIVNATVLGPDRTAEPGGPGGPGDTATAATPSTGPSPSGAPSPSTSPTSPSSSAPSTTHSSPAGPTVPPSAVLAKVRSGLVGVVASTCSPVAWSGHGTGALIGPNLVVTAWPVVAQSVSVAVLDSQGRPVPATVHRADPSLGIAVLRTDRKLTGHQFAIGDAKLTTGQQWYGVEADRLHGRDAAVARVAVDRMDVTARLGKDAVKDVGLTALAAKDHVAGGAVVGGRGRLAAITARYPGHDTLVLLDASRITAVMKRKDTPGPASCQSPLGPPGAVQPLKGSHKVLESYYSKINSGDYDKVWAMLAPQLRGDKEATFEGWRSSYIFNIRLQSAGKGQIRADFDSVFAKGNGPKGQTCARWSLVYRFDGGTIASAKAVGGGPGHRNC